jgi:quercetin dioxygenase-like cupin family protein
LSLTDLQQAYVETQVEASPRWFLDTLAWVRATGDTTHGRLSLVEYFAPPGSESPWHVHRTEDESFYVIEGSMTLIVGEEHQMISLSAGGFAFGPRNVPHGFRVTSDYPARMLFMTTGGEFAKFVLEASQPASRLSLPEPTAPDIPKLTQIAGQHDMGILGPLPK